VLDGYWAYPDDIFDFLNFSASSNFTGFSRKLKISDARQGRDVCDVVIIDKEVPIMKCLLEKLAFEGRFIGIDHWMDDRRWPQRRTRRRFLSCPVPLVRKGIGWQRDLLAQRI